MKTLNDLTPEIRAKIPQYRQMYLNGVFDGARYENFNKEIAKNHIVEVYRFCGRKPPMIFVAENIYEQQIIFNFLKGFILKGGVKNLSSELSSELDSELSSELDRELYRELYRELDSELSSELDRELSSELDRELYRELYRELDSELSSELDRELSSELSSELYRELSSELDSELFTYNYSFGRLLNVAWSNWLAFYSFVQKEFDIDVKNKEKLQEFNQSFLESGIYSAICSEMLCVICKYPKKVSKNGGRLHNDKGIAVEWGHRFKSTKYDCYYIEGVKVPEKLVMRPDSITNEDLKKINNLEQRRAYIRKLGVSKYFEILSSGDGLSLIDTDKDNQGKTMKLYSFMFETKKIQVLEVVCPSTDRVYNLYPPNQKCKNVWDAKASTFNVSEEEIKNLIIET